MLPTKEECGQLVECFSIQQITSSVHGFKVCHIIIISVLYIDMGASRFSWATLSSNPSSVWNEKTKYIYPIIITISPLCSNYDYPHYIPIRYPLCLSISTSACSSPSTLRLQGLGTGGCLTCSWSLRVPSGFAESGAGYTPGKHCNLNWENDHLSHGTFGYPILRQPPTFVPILKLLKHLSEGLFTSLRDGNRPHRIVVLTPSRPLVTANDVGH